MILWFIQDLLGFFMVASTMKHLTCDVPIYHSKLPAVASIITGKYKNIIFLNLVLKIKK